MTSQPLVTTLGLGMAAREAVRAGLDRTFPGRGAIPLRVDAVTESWLSSALGLGPVRSVRVLDEHSGTAARARIAVAAESADIPARLFVKLTPRNYLQHVLMNLFGLGVHEVHAYR